MKTLKYLMLALALAVSFCGRIATAQRIPDAPREFRGVWIAAVGNDWPSRPGLPSSQQQAEMIAILDRARAIGLNAVILQVRPCGDAMYASRLEPWSEFLTGQQGTPPSPMYDPLQFAVQEAHRRGLELHAWFNPYRASHSQMKRPLASSSFARRHPEATRQLARFLWMDPGEKSVQDHTFNVIMDVVRRYDIDGVHFDDYFYPYPDYLGGRDFPDDDVYRRSGAAARMTKAEWRRNNVNELVRRVAGGIRSVKPHVRFGISPFGIWRPGSPAGVTGLDSYNVLYNDSRRWLAEGWVDYMAPQLYWPTTSRKQNFGALLSWWAAQNTRRRHLWPGLIPDYIGGKGFSAAEIATEISLIRRTPGASGHILFSSKAVMRDKGGIARALQASTYGGGSALVPASTWLDATPPAGPAQVVLGRDATGATVVQWQVGSGEQPWLWGVYMRRSDGGWAFQALPGAQTQLTLPAGGTVAPGGFAVSAVDRVGNESTKVPAVTAAR